MEDSNINVEKELLDLQKPRYSLVRLASMWVEVLQHSDEYKNSNYSELIKKAIADIVSGKLTEEEIKKARMNLSITNKTTKEEKQEDQKKSKSEEKRK